ncbi:hypothetical protein [Shewanella phage FishSpeaker]|nr:hypothetical protein [Shewanella phage FishSpeaker]
MEQTQSTPSPATPEQIRELEVITALEQIRNTIEQNEEDPEQKSLITAVQHNKYVLLNYAMMAYQRNPTNPKMLESITSLLAQIEKTVRDDRKEKARAKEKEDDKLTFNQMMEAMKQISSGQIQLPTFNIGSFLLDPTKSLLGNAPGVNPISPAELEQGNSLVDINGTKVA